LFGILGIILGSLIITDHLATGCKTEVSFTSFS
jgi:hypothetical protein